MPPKDRFIASLSGGQKRRVSLGVAIIHKPRLAILDEPTVGVDPLLCQVSKKTLVARRAFLNIIIYQMIKSSNSNYQTKTHLTENLGIVD